MGNTLQCSVPERLKLDLRKSLLQARRTCLQTPQGKLFYAHISDQYAPFSSKVVNVGVRDFN